MFIYIYIFTKSKKNEYAYLKKWSNLNNGCVLICLMIIGQFAYPCRKLEITKNLSFSVEKNRDFDLL